VPVPELRRSVRLRERLPLRGHVRCAERRVRAVSAARLLVVLHVLLVDDDNEHDDDDRAMMTRWSVAAIVALVLAP